MAEVQTTATGSILNKALAGKPLSATDGYCLMQASGSELQDLLQAAGALRDSHKGTAVTYSRKVFLPITNLCRDRCSYCTFRKDPGEPGAWTMSPDDIAGVLARGKAAGCKEALMCLGDRPEHVYGEYRDTLRSFGHRTTVGYVRRACEMAVDEGMLPHTNAGVLTREEMLELRDVNASLGLMLENISPRLRLRGMAHFSAPDKDPSIRMRMLREAGELGIAFTTGILLGIGETPEERVDSLVAIRELHREYGHIQEVIIQNFRAKPRTRMEHAPEPHEADVARTVAVARLLLGGGMNIQAPPNLNPTGHRALLRAGINDWGGISPVTHDYVNPEAAWPHLSDLAETCAAEGFALRERLAIYPEYVRQTRFLPPRLRTLTAALDREI